MIARTEPVVAHGRQHGVGLVETMVGIFIGAIVIVVIYNILAVAENYRRTTVGSSDAQVTGLLSQFVASRDLANGGAGITMSTWSNTGPADMVNCTRNEAGAPASGFAVTSLEAAIRPIPVIITNGGGPGVSDSFISYSAGAAHVMWPVDFTANSLAGAATITVQSPNGFTVPVPTAAAPYWGVVMDGAGKCKLLRLTNAAPDVTLPLTGRVTLTVDPTTPLLTDYTTAAPARLLNIGPQGLATRVRYDVDGVNGVLRTSDLLVVPPAAVTPVPIAQNVVLMKAQYGIDTNGDGIVDCWTPADASTCNDWSEAAVRVGDLAKLNQLLAVRVGVVVRSDEPDLRLLTDPTNPQLISEASGILQATRPQVVLFNCSTNNAACQNRVVVPMGAGVPVGAPTCAPAVICDYWRYRTYETIIPIRNSIYNATTPP
ncbi:MAG TPA: PilW family protein [Casimicrobiaceae bacterium]|nr:PilW family protein [Casimicrobiaceae bacterium]